MKFLRVTLRDLFWLILAAAVIAGWGLSHYRAAQQVAARTTRHPAFWAQVSQPRPPSKESQQRMATLQRLRGLSDAQLSNYFEKIKPPYPRFDLGSEYQPCLTELIRRGMAGDIQRAYDEVMAAKPAHGDFPNNHLLLIALRRAQGRPDPLKIHVELRHRDLDDQPSTIPRVSATIENVDVEHAPIYLENGGDYRGGRPERWRVQLTNEQGERAQDANFPLGGFGGGISTTEQLAAGERGNWKNLLDARSYVHAPLPGKYELQLFHSEREIADEPNLEGLIVLKSDPVTVIVTAPSEGSTVSVVPVLVALALVGAAAIVLGIRRLWRRMHGSKTDGRFGLNRRDLICLALVTGLAIAWHCDNLYLASELRRTQLDQEANWSWQLA